MTNAELLNANLAATITKTEDHYLSLLVSAYEDAIRVVGRDAGKQFALVAAAQPDWQPPVEGAVITTAEIVAVANRLNKKLAPVWERIVVDTARAPLARIEIDWTVKHPLAANLLSQAGQRTGTRLGEAVQFTLRETLAQAYDQGLNVHDTSTLIQTRIADAAPYQADMLARSDLNSLANGSSHAAAQLSGIQFKTWLATLDDKTRIEHSMAHGQTVPINGTFTVGGEDADYPGDPNLSDAMACNCRCSLAYGDTLDEAGGLTAAVLRSSDEGSMMGAMKTRNRRRKAAPGKGLSRSADEDSGGLVDVVVGYHGAENKPHHRFNVALVAAAIPPSSTPVVDKPWDGPGNVAKIPNDAGSAVLRKMYAFVIPGENVNTKAAYHLPHHEVVNGVPGAANIPGVRNAMGRAAQIKPPLSPGDMAAVRAHLQRHLDDFNKQNKAAMVAAPHSISFTGTAAIEGQVADDNSLTPRVLLPDSLEWPEMPVSFMAQTVTAEGHDGAEVAGRVDDLARQRGVGKRRSITMSGELTTPFGINEIAPMIDDKTLRYVSADLGATEWAVVNRDTLAEVPMDELDLNDLQSGTYALGLTSGKVKAVTLVPTQALEGAMVALTAGAEDAEFTLTFPVDIETGPGRAIVASPAPVNPPRAWFETQEPPGKMPLTVTKDGRVYGHLATWDSCHVSFLPSCVPPPKSASNYSYFHVCEIDDANGDTLTVGKLMFSPGNGGHADRRLSASKASAHYDKTGMAAAYLRVSDGRHGIWAAGSLNPDLTDEQREQMRRELRLNPPSGDWRPINGQYELICGLAVAVPGFPVPRAVMSVVASGEKIELCDALIASSGLIEADAAAVAAMEHLGLVDEDLLAERKMHALAARAQGLDSLAELAGGEQ